MIAITYELCALQPLLLTRLEGDPNSSVSYPYVPGSAIRGALIGRYLAWRRRKRAGEPHDLMEDKDVRRLFFEGSVRYLNAYPLDRTGWRTLPTPLSWFYEKQSGLKPGVKIHDFAVAASQGLLQPQNVGAQFWRRFADEPGEEEDEGQQMPVYVEFADPVWEINVHTLRDRRKGRATEDGGAVFRYQALASESHLGGVILAPEKDADEIDTLLQAGDLWLGRSRSAGYGRTVIGSIRRKSGWHESHVQFADVECNGRLVLTLLSDAILRHDGTGSSGEAHRANNWGGFADRLLPELLPAPLASALELEESYKQVVPVGGFNRKWGLPLDQAQAIAAGSVFVYRATARITASDLEVLEREGVGERRVEGFGRVAANGHPDASLVVREAPTTRRLRQEVVLPEAEESLARDMVQRLLRRELDRRLAGRIARERAALGGSPANNAQLARLRALALNALTERDVPRLLAFLLDANLNRPAREQLRQARIEQERLIDWLAERLLNALPGGALARLQAVLACLAKEELPEDCRWSEDQVVALLHDLGGTAIRLLPGDSAADVAGLLADDKARKRIPKERREPCIDGVGLTKRIDNRLKQPVPIWQWLDPHGISWPQVGNVVASLNDDMAREYTIRLIEGVLHQAAKEETNG